jgi:hypothetical protein
MPKAGVGGRLVVDIEKVTEMEEEGVAVNSREIWGRPSVEVQVHVTEEEEGLPVRATVE